MIQQFLIGRGDNCQIRIHDATQRVSRTHATIKIMDNGKMFITDHSSNGTFVNGIKISQNVDFPVKRGDSVSFANTAELNWALIPKRKNTLLIYSVIAVLVIVLLAGGYFIHGKFCSNHPPVDHPVNNVDSLDIARKKLEREQAVKDSVEAVKQDSINKSKDKELEEMKRKLKEKETQEKKKNEESNNAQVDTTNKQSNTHIL